jgi:hypothetical protein
MKLNSVFKANEVGVDVGDKSLSAQPRASRIHRNCFVCPVAFLAPLQKAKGARKAAKEKQGNG